MAEPSESALHANLLLLLVGCPSPKEDTSIQDQIDALSARLDAAEGEIVSRDEEIAALQAQLAAVGDDAFVTQGDLAEFATTESLADAEELSAALEDYATREYADTAASDAADAAVAPILLDYLTSSSLDPYATDEDLAAALAGCVLSADLNTTLLSYATQTDAASLADAAEANAEAYSDGALAPVVDRLAAVEADYLTSAQFRRIEVDETWTVDPSGSGDYASVADAVVALDGVWIDADSTVTIQLVAGTHVVSSALHFRLPFGDRVQVIGNEADPASVVLEFTGTDGIIVDGTTNLGYLAGVTLQGDSTASTTGISVLDGSFLTLGVLSVDGFGTGIDAAWNAAIVTSSAGGISVASLTNGIASREGSVVYLPNSEVVGAGTGQGAAARSSYLDVSNSAVSGFTYGVLADYDSYVEADYVDSFDNSGNGFYSNVGSMLLTQYATADGNAENGFYASAGATVFAGSSIASNNAGDGYSAVFNSFMLAGGSAARDNAGYSFRQASYSVLWLDGASASGTVGSRGDNDVTDFIYGL